MLVIANTDTANNINMGTVQTVEIAKHVELYVPVQTEPVSLTCIAVSTDNVSVSDSTMINQCIDSSPLGPPYVMMLTVLIMQVTLKLPIAYTMMVILPMCLMVLTPPQV